MNHKDAKGTKNSKEKITCVLNQQDEVLCALRAFVVQMEVLS